MDHNGVARTGEVNAAPAVIGKLIHETEDYMPLTHSMATPMNVDDLVDYLPPPIQARRLSTFAGFALSCSTS